MTDEEISQSFSQALSSAQQKNVETNYVPLQWEIVSAPVRRNVVQASRLQTQGSALTQRPPLTQKANYSVKRPFVPTRNDNNRATIGSGRPHIPPKVDDPRKRNVSSSSTRRVPFVQRYTEIIFNPAATQTAWGRNQCKPTQTGN